MKHKYVIIGLQTSVRPPQTWKLFGDHLELGGEGAGERGGGRRGEEGALFSGCRGGGRGLCYRVHRAGVLVQQGRPLCPTFGRRVILTQGHGRPPPPPKQIPFPSSSVQEGGCALLFNGGKGGGGVSIVRREVTGEGHLHRGDSHPPASDGMLRPLPLACQEIAGTKPKDAQFQFWPKLLALVEEACHSGPWEEGQLRSPESPGQSRRRSDSRALASCTGEEGGLVLREGHRRRGWEGVWLPRQAAKRGQTPWALPQQSPHLPGSHR